MIRIIISQVRQMLKRRPAFLVFGILTLIMLLNFVGNVKSFRGFDIVDMFHPMRMLMFSWDKASDNANAQLLLVVLFPLIISVPAGLSYAEEKQKGMETLYVTRIGRTRYVWSRFIAVFITTFIVFTLPEFIEIALNCISFPLDANGNFMYYGVYSSEMAADINNYLFNSLYCRSVYLYAVVGVVFFGALAGVLACFTCAVSMVTNFKYRILNILPTFLLVEFSGMFDASGKSQWYRFALLFNSMDKNLNALFIAVGAVIALSLIFVQISSKRSI